MTIDCDSPIPDNPKDLVLGKPDMKALHELCQELEFNRMMSRVEEYASQFGTVDLVLESPSEPTEKGNKAKKTKKEKEEATEPAATQLKRVSDKYKSLLTEEEIEKALAAAAKADVVAVDTETTGLDPLTVDIVGASLCWKEKEAVFIPFNQELSKEKVVKLLKPFLENPKIPKGGQNSKYDWAVFKSHGIEPQGFAFDTMLESYPAGFLLPPAQPGRHRPETLQLHQDSHRGPHRQGQK